MTPAGIETATFRFEVQHSVWGVQVNIKKEVFECKSKNLAERRPYEHTLRVPMGGGGGGGDILRAGRPRRGVPQEN